MSGARDRPAVVQAVGLLLLLVCPLGAGEIHLRVGPAEEVRAVQAVERESQTSYPLAQVSSQKEGYARFEATELTEGLYDLIVLTHRGRIEGVNLRPEGVAADAPPLHDKDKEEIRRLVLGMTSFADRRRILFLKGRGTEARVLVEEVTTRKTTLRSSVPFVIWRVEVWYYRKEFGAWDRYDSERIVRQRPTVADFQKTTWVFEPALGGLAVSEATPVVEVTFRVADCFDPKAGVVAAPDGT